MTEDIHPPKFDSDDDLFKKDILKEYLLYKAALELDRTDPNKFKEIVLLYRSRSRCYGDLIYWITPMITDSSLAWEYSRQRLVEMGSIKDVLK